MPEDRFFEAAFPLIMMIPVALFFVGLGLRGLVLRRPFLLSSWWLFALLVLCFLPGMGFPFFGFGSRSGDFDVMNLVFLILFALVIAFMALHFRGYTAFAVTDTSMREALLAALQKKNLSYEETLGSVRLPSLGMDLQVAVSSRVGTGQISARGARRPAELRAIVQEMNDYFRSNPVETNLITCVLDLVLGAAILLMQISFFNRFSS